ncbi:LysR family transcriptional regulator [Paraburkholderia susongensis]|uniref:DNA-binding transcriptional regulator, LysR family n=1 Tax=Paraburkholderia susongensis TaxID=1515439 RepID=A0A1X7HXD0_9BURK|nr:LysR substrate-binding domain-containing protein [Paraburkholderia susongensis]SMG06662.1 DNA-binding transcriptional regulator, LysR family [Paraburkholderia susongensis]
MRFKLRQMEVFRAVMLTGSINAAAKMLYVSQPAVSKLVSHTETTLGLRLFERAKGRLIPTAEAQALFREVEQVYQSALRVDEFARALALGPASLLRVACSPSLATAIVELKRKLPRLRVDWHTTLMAEMPLEVLSKTVDVAVTSMPIEHEHLEVVPFMRGRMVCVLPPDHPLAQQPRIALADLTSEPMILFRRDIPFGTMVVRACQQVDVDLTSVVDVTRADQALALVRGGLGLAIVDEFAAAEADCVVRPLVENLEMTSTFVYSKFSPPTRNAMLLMRAVYRRAEQLGRQIGSVPGEIA